MKPAEKIKEAYAAYYADVGMPTEYNRLLKQEERRLKGSGSLIYAAELPEWISKGRNKKERVKLQMRNNINQDNHR